MKAINFLQFFALILMISLSKSKPIHQEDGVFAMNTDNTNSLNMDHNTSMRIVYRNELTQFLGIMKDVIIEKIFSSNDDEANSANKLSNALYVYMITLITAFYFNN